MDWKANRPINKIIIHCSATPRGRDVDIEEIDRWHRERGFFMVGYHYVIKLDGTLQVGRPLDRPGAHAKGHNRHSIGICLVGGTNEFDVNVPENTFTDEQFATLHSLLNNLILEHPDAVVIGHNEVDSHKDCPSFDVQQWLTEEYAL